MISTQYRLPWFLVEVTMQKSMHELGGLQMRLAVTRPSHGKKKSLFLRSISQKYEGSTGNFKRVLGTAHGPYNQQWVQGLFCRVCSYFPPYVSEYCCLSRISFFCVYLTLGTGGVKRNQTSSLASSHKPSHHAT